MTSTENRREEALTRLKILEDKGLEESVYSQYKESGTVFYSERMALGFNENGEPAAVGILYWINNDSACFENGKPFKEVVEYFERTWNATVFHATHEYTAFGELLDLFYVSNHPEEWADDRADLADGLQYAYVYNANDEFMSEIGSIGFRVAGGGVVRVS